MRTRTSSLDASNRAAQQSAMPRYSHMKARQSIKIREIRDALIAEGLITLASQAKALDLSRSTTWAVLQAAHKSSGLSGAIIKRMLASPHLPTSVRDKILQYVQDKSAGLYGHSTKRLRIFNAQFKQIEESASGEEACAHEI